VTLLFIMLFVFSLSWLFYVYVGYPISLWLIGIGRQFRPKTRDNFLPFVSVLIAARNEEKDVAWKISETLNWDYPKDRLELLVASDASEDRTDEILRGVGDPRLKVLFLERRMGKNEALNQLAHLAKGEILFFTDANSHVHSLCARRMVRHFADERVGCVTGTDRTETEESESAIGIGEKSYWGYESRVQMLESSLGSVLICFGAIFCIRTSLFKPLQPALANDLELPIRIGSAGYAVIFEPAAWAIEKATHSPKEEFNRRRRICGQGLLGFWRLRKCLRGLRAWQFISRKFLRWTAIVPLSLLLVSSAALAFNPYLKAIFVMQLALYFAAFVGWGNAIWGGKGRQIFALPLYFVLVNSAALAGLIETCFGRRYNIWDVASMTRGSEVPTTEGS
jgi:biofilm PGA synthesis N-glycosyltransferase PgaC